MVNPEIKKKLIEDLKNLPFDSQKKVQEFAHALLITQHRGKSGKEMIKFSGILTNDEAGELRRIIESGCEMVDINEW
jgi:hypothetical protein